MNVFTQYGGFQGTIFWSFPPSPASPPQNTSYVYVCPKSVNSNSLLWNVQTKIFRLLLWLLSCLYATSNPSWNTAKLHLQQTSRIDHFPVLSLRSKLPSFPTSSTTTASWLYLPRVSMLLTSATLILTPPPVLLTTTGKIIPLQPKKWICHFAASNLPKPLPLTRQIKPWPGLWDSTQSVSRTSSCLHSLAHSAPTHTGFLLCPEYSRPDLASVSL